MRLMGAGTVLEREVYGLTQAAHLLGMPPPTLWRWLDGYERGRTWYQPVIRVEPTGNDRLTWGEFVEAGYLRQYRELRVPLQRLRPVITRLRAELETLYPLATARPFVADRELVGAIQDDVDLEEPLRLVRYRDGQWMLTPTAETFFQSVVFDGNVAVQLRPDGHDSPVTIDPLRAFGEPVVRGVRTDLIREAVLAGEPIDLIADGYQLTRDQVDAAVRYELRRAA